MLFRRKQRRKLRGTFGKLIHLACAITDHGHVCPLGGSGLALLAAQLAKLAAVQYPEPLRIDLTLNQHCDGNRLPKRQLDKLGFTTFAHTANRIYHVVDWHMDTRQKQPGGALPRKILGQRR